jgi:hypothetical protein
MKLDSKDCWWDSLDEFDTWNHEPGKILHRTTEKHAAQFLKFCVQTAQSYRKAATAFWNNGDGAWMSHSHGWDFSTRDFWRASRSWRSTGFQNWRNPLTGQHEDDEDVVWPRRHFTSNHDGICQSIYKNWFDWSHWCKVPPDCKPDWDYCPPPPPPDDCQVLVPEPASLAIWAVLGLVGTVPAWKQLRSRRSRQLTGQ